MGIRFSIKEVQSENLGMSRLALGTVQFGFPYGIANHVGQVTFSAAKSMIKLSAAKGVDTIDTAIAYGESETCLGGAGVHGFKVITKLPRLPDNCKDIPIWINTQVQASIDRLGLNHVYGLLLHTSDQLLSLYGKVIYESLQNLKQAGLIQKVGISIYSPTELDVLIKRFQFDIVQAPFNLVDRRLHITGWLQRLKEDDVEIHTRSSFLQGLLLMPQTAIPPKFAPWNNLWHRWYTWLSYQNISPLEACLAFSLSFPEIDRVIVGADSVKQLQQIIEAASTVTVIQFPNLSCDDENLINPSRWSQL